MISGLFGSGSTSWKLRGGLEELSATHSGIAQRVSDASRASATTDFSQVLGEAESAAGLTEEELQRDMAALADTQLRYEAASRLLNRAYTDLRTAIRSNG